jgi:hypothetical protein
VAAASGKIVWVGRGISVLASLVFLLSALMKLKGGPELAQGMAEAGSRDDEDAAAEGELASGGREGRLTRIHRGIESKPSRPDLNPVFPALHAS